MLETEIQPRCMRLIENVNYKRIPYYEQFYEQTLDVIELCDYTELSRDMVRQRLKPKHII